jgi:hypothetical protein
MIRGIDRYGRGLCGRVILYGLCVEQDLGDMVETQLWSLGQQLGMRKVSL